MKQEFEEAAEKMYKQSYDEFGEPTWDEGELFHRKEGFIEGAKWQEERNYNDMQEYADYCMMCFAEKTLKIPLLAKDWTEQFKKK